MLYLTLDWHWFHSRPFISDIDRLYLCQGELENVQALQCFITNQSESSTMWSSNLRAIMKANEMSYPLCLNHLRLNSGFRSLGPFLPHAMNKRTYQKCSNIGPASPMTGGAFAAYRNSTGRSANRLLGANSPIGAMGRRWIREVSIFILGFKWKNSFCSFFFSIEHTFSRLKWKKKKTEK
jgi:hypothetical protein